MIIDISLCKHNSIIPLSDTKNGGFLSGWEHTMSYLASELRHTIKIPTSKMSADVFYIYIEIAREVLNASTARQKCLRALV